MGVKRRRGVVYVILTIVMLPVFGAFIAMAIEMIELCPIVSCRVQPRNGRGHGNHI